MTYPAIEITLDVHEETLVHLLALRQRWKHVHLGQTLAKVIEGHLSMTTSTIDKHLGQRPPRGCGPHVTLVIAATPTTHDAWMAWMSHRPHQSPAGMRSRKNRRAFVDMAMYDLVGAAVVREMAHA